MPPIEGEGGEAIDSGEANVDNSVELDTPATPIEDDPGAVIDNGEPEGEGGEPEKPAPKPKEPVVEKRKYKVKVDGEEVEIDEDTAVKDYELRSASYKRMEAAAGKVKQAEEFMAMFKKSPIDMIKKLGLDPRQISEDYLVQDLEYELLTPEEKLAKYEQKDQERLAAEEQAKEDAKINQMKSHYQQQVDVKLTEALTNAGLPKQPKFAARAIDYAKQMLGRGFTIESIPWNDVVGYAKEDALGEAQHFFADMEGEQLINTLGADIINKVRQYDLAKRKATPETAPGKTAQSKKAPKSDDYIDMDTFMAGLG